MDGSIKRKRNEKEFGNWNETSTGREYWFEIAGRNGGKGYVKEVDRNEITISFRQEILNSDGILVEVHQKFPEDKGHTKV